MIRSPSVFFVLLLSLACGSNAGVRSIDLSDRVVEKPPDGIGHYVYALSLPEVAEVGEAFEVQMEWRTVGGVDPNARYTLDVRLVGPARRTYSFPAGANTVGELHLANWFSHAFAVAADFPVGEYDLEVRLRDANKDDAQVPLGFDPQMITTEGYYRLATLRLVNGAGG